MSNGSASSHVSSVASSSLLSPLDRITDSNTLFFLCDIQETFRGKILGYEGVISVALFLARAANQLGIPCATTEQRPFKPTVAELQSEIDAKAHPNQKLFGKSLFSMLTPEVTAWANAGPHAARRHVVLFGIEAHVCVLQTALDLLRAGYHVHVVLDGISSQNSADRDAALARLSAEAARRPSSPGAGVLHLTSAESVLFEILRDATHPQFKALMPAIKDLAAAKKAAPATGVSGQGQAKL